MAIRLPAWLTVPKIPVDGVMSLGDHLRELRYRIIISTVVIVVMMLVCLIFRDVLFRILMYPWAQALEQLAQSQPNINARAIVQGVVAPFTLMMKVSLTAGLVVSSPFWLYQVWAFIVPGLVAKERKSALLFLGTTVPLFLAGVAVAYYVLPQGIAVLLSFTPDSVPVDNLLDLNYFLDFLLRLMLVFGIAFVIPVVVVILNRVGVIPASALASGRKFIIFGVFVFAAVATPSQDPFSMLALALPMTLLLLIAEWVCHRHDKKKAKEEA